MKLKDDLSLIMEFTSNNFKIRYEHGFLGYLWSIITPLIMLATLYVVFSLIMKLDVPHYQLFLLIGIIFWNFLSDSTTTSMNSILENANIIKKINFPKYVVVVSSCLSSFISLLLNFLVFFIFTLVLKVEIGFIAILLPFYLFEIFMFSLGVSFFISSIYPKHRELQHIWSLFLLIGFWLTPIIYSEMMIPKKYLKYYMLNPLARLINETRDILIYNYSPEFKQIMITFFICIGVFIIGFLFFKKRSMYFAEDL